MLISSPWCIYLAISTTIDLFPSKTITRQYGVDNEAFEALSTKMANAAHITSNFKYDYINHPNMANTTTVTKTRLEDLGLEVPRNKKKTSIFHIMLERISFNDKKNQTSKMILNQYIFGLFWIRL